MASSTTDSIRARGRLPGGDTSHDIFRLDHVDDPARLPYAVKVLLDNQPATRPATPPATTTGTAGVEGGGFRWTLPLSRSAPLTVASQQLGSLPVTDLRLRCVRLPSPTSRR
jgi:hypothetical protein